MTSSAKILNLQFIDVPIDCCYPAFKKDKTLCYEYYRTVLLNGELYEIGDYAVINASEDVEVAKFICIYSTRERKVEVVVRKYPFARNLRDQLITEGCTEFDEKNEVVEDFRRDYIIKAEQIVKKCGLVLALPDDSANVIRESGLDPLLHFFCRYTLKPDGLFPFVSSYQNILSENNFKNPSTKLDSAKKQKRKPGSENVPFTQLEDCNDCNFKSTQDKMRSPKNPHKNIKISEGSINSGSPIQRNLVKRNLNESFGNSPSQSDKSILNYSIVSDEDTDKPFVLKLKVSEKNKTPIVVLKKFDDDNFQVLRLKQEKGPKQVEHSPVRKSSRVKVRKSYADYISPIKSTPIKRGAVWKGSENEEKICSQNGTSAKKSSRKERTRKTEEFPETPTKSLSQSEDSRLGTRPIRTPKRYQGEIEAPYVKKLNLETTVRRSLRLTQTDDAQEIIASPRNSRRNRQRESISSDEEEYKTNIRTPAKRVNLDESIRRSILKGRLNVNELEEEIALDASDRTPSKRQRRATKKFSFDSSSDDKETAVSKTKTTNRINLAEPMRRSGLRVRLNSNELEEKKVSNALVKSPSKRQHGNTKDFYFNSSSDDEGNAKSKIKTTNSSSSTLPKTKGKKINVTEHIPKTPKSRKNVDTPRSLTKQTPKTTVNQSPKTPKNRAKLIRDGLITPSMQSRSKAVEGDSTPLMKARSQLHVSYVPSALPCREKEYCDVFNFLEGKLLDGCGGCMYISGVPGTGKTATVTCVINNLLKNDDIPKFSYVSVNGMRLTEPRQCYVEIMKQLTGKTIPWEQAQNMLEERFTKSKKLAPVVMLIDELDILCTKRQDVVYNLLDWPTKAKNQLIVVTIANTMDLPERLLMNRVTSRLGLTRLTFQAYTHKQLQEIVTKRLSGTDSFNPDAIQFVARKVASVSGDARRALDICRRAAEIAEAEGKSQLVNMSHVNEALNAMITQPKVRAIKNCSRLEQLILQSIVAEVERTGVEETTFADIFKMLVSCAAIDGFRMVSSTNALSAVSRLSACRLLLTDQKCNDINQRIILNVSVDDVYYALKRD